MKEQPSLPSLNIHADVDETATFLKVPRSWVYSRTRRNAIPCVRVGKYLRFDLAEIDMWARAGCPTDWREALADLGGGER